MQSLRPKHTAIKTAAVIAVAAELGLCAAFLLFGKYSPVRSEDTNIFGVATLFFHAPGLLLAKALFGDSNSKPAVAYAEMIGAVQIRLLAWVIIEFRRRGRTHNDA